MNIFFTVIGLFLLLYYLGFIIWIRFGLSRLVKNKSEGARVEFISIIIPFRNESANILNSLKSISSLNYPTDKFEALYINDSSTDDSFAKIENASKPSNIKLLNFVDLSSKYAFKKKAVEFGIQNAQGQIIVLTDTDCTHHPEWLFAMINNFDADTAMVSGPVEFLSDGSVFHEFQKLEFEGLIEAGAGLIGNNNPTICSAANLAFRKEAFYLVGGYKDNMNLSSGDDEFLMQKIHRQTDYKIKFSLHPDSIVKTDPNKNISQFFEQRRRWSSKGFFYKSKFLIFTLVLIFLFYISLPVQLILGIFYQPYFILMFLLSLLLKMFIEFLVLRKGKKLLFKDLKLRFIPAAEIFQIPYIIIAPLLGLLGNFNWKGRKLKR
ncbi:MAG: glycosyltransferase [bacterium]